MSADLVILNLDGSERYRFPVSVDGAEVPLPWQAILRAGEELSGDESVNLEVGSHLVPLGHAKSSLSERRLPAFIELISYTGPWYDRDVLAGKRILPWHQEYFNEDTDAGNLAAGLLVKQVLFETIDRRLDKEEALQFLEERAQELGTRGVDDPLSDSVVRDEIYDRLRRRGWIGTTVE